MTISNSRVSVTTAGTLLATNDATETQDNVRGGLWQTRPRRYAMRNAGAAVAYIGDSNVGTATGYSLGAGSALQFEMEPGESLYGIASAGTVVFEVLRGGD